MKTAPATVAVGGESVYTTASPTVGPCGGRRRRQRHHPPGVALVSVTTTRKLHRHQRDHLRHWHGGGGQRRHLTVTVRPPATAPDTIANTVTTSSSTPDPNPANNTSTVQTTLVNGQPLDHQDRNPGEARGRSDLT